MQPGHTVSRLHAYTTLNVCQSEAEIPDGVSALLLGEF